VISLSVACIYTHHTSTKEFQQSIAEVIADELVGQVKGSGVFSENKTCCELIWKG
jgi:hypothetical protein